MRSTRHGTRYARISSLARRHWRTLVVALGSVVLVGHAISLHVLSASRQELAVTLHDYVTAPLRDEQPRGIVLPLYDGIALLGISLIHDVRALGVDLPIEVPHCGDLSAHIRTKLQQDNVLVYDVCAHAVTATETDVLGTTRPLFCDNLAHCHQRFRSFDIKILALVFSRFEELMMLDADVLFFQNPMSLWDTAKYRTTGTLFFHDRISFTGSFLDQVVSSTPVRRNSLHHFVETFDRSIFQRLPTVDRDRPALRDGRPTSVPSKLLQTMHSWKMRAGHEADSSVMLWNKRKQVRATTILASFITLRHRHRPPSYGDKELYWLACEVGDAEYAFSEYGVGAVGVDARVAERVLCGDALHFYPTATEDQDPSPLYINSDHILTWQSGVYRTKARAAAYDPGHHRDLPQECPFNVSVVPLSEQDASAFARRQRLYRRVENEYKTTTSEV